MKLKDLLEMESHEADLMRKEASDDAFMAEIIDNNDGAEITMMFNDGVLIATIGFDKNNYVTIDSLEIDDVDDGIEVDLAAAKKIVEKAVENAIDDLFDGETTLSDEIDTNKNLPTK